MKTSVAACMVGAILLASSAAHADRSWHRPWKDAEACRSLIPASIGGPTPPGSVMTLRWLGTTNFELAFRGQVVLLDAYYDRGPRNRPIGFTPDEVIRADAIFIGHGHFDHMSDAVQVAMQTGAQVVGGPPTIDAALSMGLPPAQAVSVSGGEVIEFDGFTVEAILAHHSVLDSDLLEAFTDTITTAIGEPTPEEAAAEQEIRARGTFAPEVITQGTIAYLFTFDSGFQFIYRDTAGPITPEEEAVMARIGGETDLATVAYQGQYLARLQIPPTLDLIKLYNPKMYLPNHHDEIAGIFLDIGVEPLFMAIREELPDTKTVSPLYREPVCVHVRRSEHALR